MIIRLLILAILAAALAAGGYYAVQELYIKPEQRLQADRRLPAPAPPPDPSVVEYERCMELWKRGAPPSEARAAFERLLKEFPETRKRRDALDAIGQINSQEFFTQTPNETNLYVVNPGDSLSRVSNRRKLPIELILYLNKLPSENLQIGQRLIAPQSAFRVHLQQKTRLVILHNGEKFFRQYPALTWPGANKTPVIFRPKETGKVTDKVGLTEKAIIKPTDPEYFKSNHIVNMSINGFALYTQPEDPAAFVSRPSGGGVGLAPAHMSEIAILLPRGTPVTLD